MFRKFSTVKLSENALTIKAQTNTANRDKEQCSKAFELFKQCEQSHQNPSSNSIPPNNCEPLFSAFLKCKAKAGK